MSKKFNNIEGVPSSVIFAAKFVEMSLYQQRSSVHPTGEGGEGERVYKLEVTEFHPKQSAAFDCACNLLGSFFSDELNRLHREAIVDAADDWGTDESRWEIAEPSEGKPVGGYE